MTLVVGTTISILSHHHRLTTDPPGTANAAMQTYKSHPSVKKQRQPLSITMFLKPTKNKTLHEDMTSFLKALLFVDLLVLLWTSVLLCVTSWGYLASSFMMDVLEGIFQNRLFPSILNTYSNWFPLYSMICLKISKYFSTVSLSPGAVSPCSETYYNFQETVKSSRAGLKIFGFQCCQWSWLRFFDAFGSVSSAELLA